MNKTIYALGFFDGVHLGHQALLAACGTLAREVGACCGAVTFGQHPQSLVLGGAPGLINTPADRERLLRAFGGLDRVITLPFDEAMRAMPWEDFLGMLMADYQAAGFVCGDDFRFGFRGQGNAEKLAAFCREHALAFRAVEEQTVDGIRISSTHIRGLLEEGRVADANRFLGHPHIRTGRVVPGQQLGRRLGIPTANLEPEPALAQLRHGVYACTARVDGESYIAVTNVGRRPTVSGTHVTVEPWLLDYSGDLYGRELTLMFHAFLRPEQKFPDLDALKAAVHADADAARQLLKNL